jgi:outer membrane receptor protein involved in Fe transport
VYHGWFSRYGRPEEIFANTSQEDITRYTSSIATQWQASRWLSTRGTVGFDNSDSQLDALDQQGQGMIPTGDRVNIRTVTPVITGDFGASANTFINEHLSSRTSVGVQYTNRLQRTERFEGAGLPAGGQTVAGAQTVTVSESTNQAVVAGGYLEQLLGWRDELFVTGAVRADGGSSFGKNFHTAVYPKASVSWLALGSGSSRQVEWIDRLRLRFAYGTSGVQPGSTDALPLYTRFTTIVDGANASGAALIATGNPDLRPERSSEMETGADADFLGGRVSLEATYYNRLSRDALIQRPLPTSSGLSSQWVNVGALRNRGAELGLNLRLAETRRFTASLGVNGSYNANKLITLGIPNTTAIGSSDARSVAGYPILSRWAKPILGYADANHNGIIEPTEVRVGDSVVFIGPSDPPRQATVSPTLTFLRGALTFRSVFQYAGGQTGENSGMTTGCRDFPSCRAVNDPSAPLADQAAAVALVTYKTSAGYLRDATFWRWREASLTYDVPEQFRRPLHARTLSVTVSARNLWLWTHYGYPDPEGNNGFADLPEGTVTQATMPQPRYFLLRLNLNY